MCGLAGFLGYGDLSEEQVQVIALRMGDTIAHRGPDDSGVWLDAQTQIALTHRRLAILDLSPAGHQPMISASGRYVIVFNGEIYNHSKIRKDVQDVRGEIDWQGHSDTETLLAGFDTWGVETVIKKTIGMFAIAVWDRTEQILTLVRDRMGEKPLYYGWQNGIFLFGSELKAIKKHPSFLGEIDRGAIATQLRHNYIPAPYSIYTGISKLPPGTLLRIQGTKDKIQEEPKPYWSFSEVVTRGQEQRFDGDAVEALDRLLRDAVAQQMAADVPLGAFLSGGIDSSTVVALMQAQSDRPIKTFTIGFDEDGFNEAIHAKAVAQHLRTEHTELYITPKQAMEVIPRLPTLYDEPFSDSSQIPTFLVSEMTRRQVTVALSGDGGDELFGGYNRYTMTAQWWNKIQSLPRWGRLLASRSLGMMSSNSLNWIGRIIAGLSSKKSRWYDLGVNFDRRIVKLRGVLVTENPIELYRWFCSHWTDPGSVVIGGQEKTTQFTQSFPHTTSFLEQMMMLDAVSYLPDDILVKVDRAAMGVSLETRVPFLDHRVAEFAWSLPTSMKIHNNQGKWILRQVLYKYVPKELIERPKMGFGVPIDSWLRGPLRDWAESLLDVSRLRQEGFFDPTPIQKKWDEHLTGRFNWQYDLWDVLMFQAWLDAQ